MNLNQYYTDQICSDVLVNNLSIPYPRIALDLGFGSGNLLNAAKRRWKHLNLIGIDIDTNNVKLATSTIKAFEYNGFDPDLPDLIKDKFGNIDLLISNPPYFSIDLNNNNKKILQSAGLIESISETSRKVPAELIFLAQNLRLLSKTGELGIILPAGLISGQRWQVFRECLFTSYNVTNIIQLPINSFKKTDAQTFILILKNKESIQQGVILSHINHSKKIIVDLREAITRSDYNFYAKNTSIDSFARINQRDFILFRGNKSHNNLTKMGIEHIHTTNMPKEPTKAKIQHEQGNELKHAIPGDILVSRVGRRCIGRLLKVTRGCLPISDCIIVIRPRNKAIGTIIWKKLTDDLFQDHLSKAALGVSAKYITYNTIKGYLISCHENTK